MALLDYDSGQLNEALTGIRAIKIPTSSNTIIESNASEPLATIDLLSLSNALPKTYTFSITLFNSDETVTGTNVISKNFFVVPPIMDGMNIVDISWAFFTNPSSGQTYGFRILNTGSIIKTQTGINSNIVSGSIVPTITTINSYQHIYVEFLSETTVTDGIGLSFTFTVQ